MHGAVNIRIPKWILALAAALALIVGLSACDATEDAKKPSAASDAAARTNTVNGLISAQPAHTMSYSSSRDAINKWIDVWGKKGAISYIYLQNSDGEVINSFVMKGLPVSYCTGITRPYDFVNPGDHVSGDGVANVAVPAPGVDGVYYSGGDCSRYYGTDATSGAYLEFSVGQGQQMLLYNKPLPGSYKSYVPGKDTAPAAK